MCPKTKDADEAVKQEVRNVIYNMCAAKEHITVDSLLQRIRDKEIIEIGRTSLYRLIKSIGFQYSIDGNRRGLCEKPHIAHMRVKFLREYMEYKENLSYVYKQVVFLDETWIFQRGQNKKIWHDSSVKSVKDASQSSHGKRYMIIHAGTTKGFLNGAGKLFACSSKSHDYHDNMNHELFEDWFKHVLISLNEPSLIVLDNASYHSRIINKQPTSSWTKSDIIKWLEEHNVPDNGKHFKVELLETARAYKEEKEYIIDQMALSYGHKVLRLPPYHCEFNAIELIWGIAKNYYDRHIGINGYAEQNVLDMWEESLQQITSEIWENSIRHTEEIIKKWWKREQMIEDVQPLIISANTGESSDYESESDDGS